MVFPIRAYVNKVIPWQGHFWPQGHNLNKLGRGPLGDATYKISRLYALWAQTRFFHVFPYVKHGTPGVGPFSAPGA